MGAVAETMLLFAQNAAPTPTPDAVDVKLVDDSEWWEKFVVPAVTLLAALGGGIGGVVIGGRMNRATMSALETERAKREERWEETKAARELAIERRLAVGSLRLLIHDLSETARMLETESASGSQSGPDRGLYPPEYVPAVQLREEDKHAIAMWVSSEIWARITFTLELIRRSNRRRDSEREARERGERNAGDAAWYGTGARAEANTIRTTVATLTAELGRLEKLDAGKASSVPPEAETTRR